jgi:hypothetical protein
MCAVSNNTASMIRTAISNKSAKRPLGMEVCEIRLDMAIEDYVLMRLKDDNTLTQEIRKRVIEDIAEHIGNHIHKYADVKVEQDGLAQRHMLVVRMGICPVREL